LLSLSHGSDRYPSLHFTTRRLGISHIALELASWDLPHEHLVKLLVASICSLDLVEPEVDDAEKREAAEEEGNLIIMLDVS
jgi:hypothetical protein